MVETQYFPDLKNPEAVNAYLRICEDADVVLENFRPGVSDRLGVGPEAVKAINPDVIYCAISGFGHKGPRAGDPAMDFYPGILRSDEYDRA